MATFFVLLTSNFGLNSVYFGSGGCVFECQLDIAFVIFVWYQMTNFTLIFGPLSTTVLCKGDFINRVVHDKMYTEADALRDRILTMLLEH